MPGIAAEMKQKRAKQLVTEVVGLTMSDAVRRIKEAYLEVAVLSVGDQVWPLEGGFNSNRVGVVIEGGVVRGAQIG